MKELNDKIIKWLKKHNIDKLSPDKQYLKVLEEVGELARGLLKNDLEAIKDAIGDIYIALVGYSLQQGETDFEIERIILWAGRSDKIIALILYWLGECEGANLKFRTLECIVGGLRKMAIINNLTLKECVEHAYNEIKDRDIKIIEGVAVK